MAGPRSQVETVRDYQQEVGFELIGFTSCVSWGRGEREKNEAERTEQIAREIKGPSILRFLVCLVSFFLTLWNQLWLLHIPSCSKISLLLISTFLIKCRGVARKGDSQDSTMGRSPRGRWRDRGWTGETGLHWGENSSGGLQTVEQVSAVFSWDRGTVFSLVLCNPATWDTCFVLSSFKGPESQYVHVEVWWLPLTSEFSYSTVEEGSLHKGVALLGWAVSFAASMDGI